MDDVNVWLVRAKSNLMRGKNSSYLDLRDISIEDLCFDLQQCAEKCLKAILIANNAEFPKTHNISELLILIRLKTTIIIPEEIKEASLLTDYAVNTRYPSDYTPVSEEEHREAVKTAEDVYNWAKNIIETGNK